MNLNNQYPGLEKIIYLQDLEIWKRHFSEEVPNPQTLMIEVSSVCNLNCSMCPKTYQIDPSQKAKFMEKEVFERLQPFFEKVDEVILTGFGESFLHPKIFDFIELAASSGTFVSITTNGTLLEPEFSKHILKSGLASLQISLDAANSDTYYKIRGKKIFEKLINNIRYLVQLKKETNHQIPVIGLAFVAMHSNIAELPDFIDLAADLGVENVGVGSLDHYYVCQDLCLVNYLQEAKQHFLEAKKRAEQAKAKTGLATSFSFEFPFLMKILKEQYREEDLFLKEFGINPTIPILEEFLSAYWQKTCPSTEDKSRKCDSLADISHQYDSVMRACQSLHSTGFINAEGELLPCCRVSRNIPFPILGHITKDGFAASWNSAAMRRLRQDSMDFRKVPLCQACRQTHYFEKTSLELMNKTKLSVGYGAQLGLGWNTVEKVEKAVAPLANCDKEAVAEEVAFNEIYRWSRAASAVFLKNLGCSVLVINLVPGLLKAPQKVEIYINDRKIGHTVVDPQDRQILVQLPETQEAIFKLLIASPEASSPWRTSKKAVAPQAFKDLDHRTLALPIIFFVQKDFLEMQINFTEIRAVAPQAIAAKYFVKNTTDPQNPGIINGWANIDVGWGCWALGRFSMLSLGILPKADYLVRLRIMLYPAIGNSCQSIAVSLNNQPIINLLSPKSALEWQDFTFKIPADLILEDKENLLTFQYSNFKPLDELINGQQDNRPLAAAFNFLKLCRLPKSKVISSNL